MARLLVHFRDKMRITGVVVSGDPLSLREEPRHSMSTMEDVSWGGVVFSLSPITLVSVSSPVADPRHGMLRLSPRLCEGSRALIRGHFGRSQRFR